MSIRRTLQLALALMAASMVFAISSSAGAVENPDYEKPAEEVKRPTPQPVRTPSNVVASRQQLAITGSDAAQLGVLGAVLVTGGAATLVVRRRAAA